MATIPEQLQADLKTAMRARDQAAVRAIRSALAAIANAEAPPIELGGRAGMDEAPTEHDRLVLTDADHHRIVAAEVADRHAAAAEYDAVGQPDAAAAVRAELAALQPYL